MSSALKRATARFEGIGRYVPGGPAATDEGKLSANESPFGVSPAVRSELAASIDRVHRYDDGMQTRRLLADSLGIDVTELLLTSGSDELCYLIASLFLHDGDHHVVLSDPSYAIDVTVSLLAGASIRKVPLRQGAHDLEGLLEASRGASLLWLPTPHNPTGCAVPPAELADFVARVPDTCIVVLDEAYRGYLDEEWVPDTLSLVRAHSNVLVQRTFSKHHALAGLRVGYGLAQPEVIRALEVLKSPFNVNAAALAGVRGSLHSAEWDDMAVAAVLRERELFTAFLRGQGIDYFESQANFVTIRLSAAEIGAAVEGAGLSIRAGEGLGLPGWCRVTIGWPPQMALLRDALRSVAREGAPRP